MEKIAVIGCGTMGHSIALSSAWAGLQVKMFGLNHSEIEKAKDNISGKLSMLLENSLIEMEEVAEIEDRISTTNSLDDAVSDATFIIEAVPEDVELKNELLIHLDRICHSDVILASSTSGFSPTRMARSLSKPERTLVTHFWNPAHLIPLVEIVRGVMTNDATVKRAFDLLLLMGKKPVVLQKEVPGFIGNRLQAALFREAQHILNEGIASKEDIDATVTFGLGRRLAITGPFASADMGGLDVFASISKSLFCDLSNSNHPFPALLELVENNKLGSKTGEGYYVWDSLHYRIVNQKREAELIRHLKNDLAHNA